MRPVAVPAHIFNIRLVRAYIIIDWDRVVRNLEICTVVSFHLATAQAVTGSIASCRLPVV